jgi:hypothetical protein
MTFDKHLTTARRSRPTWHGIPVLSLTAWSLLGCSRYVPVTEATPAPPTGTVRVMLAARGTLAVVEALGPNVRSVEGSVVRITADSLSLRAEEVTQLTGGRITMPAIPVSVARSDVLSIEAQRADTRRSILAVTALLVGIFVFTSRFDFGGPGSIDEGPAPPPVTRIPR